MSNPLRVAEVTKTIPQSSQLFVMNNVKINFGNRVKQLRKQLNISQEELGFQSGLSKNYISDVERGTRNISLEAIEKIAIGLEVEMQELFDWRK